MAFITVLSACIDSREDSLYGLPYGDALSALQGLSSGGTGMKDSLLAFSTASTLGRINLQRLSHMPSSIPTYHMVSLRTVPLDTRTTSSSAFAGDTTVILQGTAAH